MISAPSAPLFTGNLSLTVDSGDALDVREFSVQERLSSLFNVSLVALGDNPAIDFDAVVGKPARFALVGETQTRFWAGICSHLQQVGVDEDGLSTYQVTLVPDLWLATQRRNYRMFQQISEPDIVRKLLSEWNIEPDVRLSGTYKKRKYRVQYAESDYAFMSRMLEDAGISFYFVQAKTQTKLVLSDAPQAAELRAPPIAFRDHPMVADREHVTRVRIGQQVRPGRYTVRDHDYRLPPSYNLVSSAEGAGVDIEKRLERYHYAPGAFLFAADKGEDTPLADDKGKARTDETEASLLTKKRLDAKRGIAKICTFETNVLDLAPGVVMSIADHPRPDLGAGKRQLIVEVTHSGTSAGEWSHHCEARSADRPYRPALDTPRPRAIGVESATVVGPPGEEIHTDEFGRVRVHFHWDRESKMDDNSSCWIHVSQPWGGAGFGGMNLPRVGQEVLVDFLGGDPDRPVIIGRVFTNLQKVPYALPAGKTQSGWKSQSSPGGGGSNEMRFEDAKGKEQVYIQAEKDMKRLTKNNEDVTVGNNQKILVKNDQSVTVGNTLTKLVGNSEREITGTNRSTVVGVNRSSQIGVLDSTMVGHTYTVAISPPGDVCAVSPTSFTMTDKKIVFDTGAGAKITMMDATVKIEADTICLCAESTVSIMSQKTTSLVGTTKLTMGSNSGDVSIQGNPSVLINNLSIGTPQAVFDAIAARINDLISEDLTPDNKDGYDAFSAIEDALTPQKRAIIDKMADRYGLPRQLLMGIIASEMDFDHDAEDQKQTDDALAGNWFLGTPGIASVKPDTLEAAREYLQHPRPDLGPEPGRVDSRPPLQGAEHAARYDNDTKNRATFEGSVEAAAIVTTMIVDAKGGLSAVATTEDMAVVWGAFRTGIIGLTPTGTGFTTTSLRDNEIQSESDKAGLPSRMHVGQNAYMSKPLFDLFELLYSPLPKICCP